MHHLATPIASQLPFRIIVSSPAESMTKPVFLALLALLACAAYRSAAAAEDGLQQGQQHPGGGGGLGRRVLRLKGIGGSVGVIRSGMGLPDAGAARLCVMQCLQHACISWHKIYMSESGASLQEAVAVPAAAADCLLQCGMAEVESGCLAQTYHRLLNASPLQYSCSSRCVTGLLHSVCTQCGGGGSGCSALQLNTSVAGAECLVDAAV